MGARTCSSGDYAAAKRKSCDKARQLADHLSNWESVLTDNAIEILMHRLRKKLESSGFEVRTIRGLGYLVEKAV
ncbi:MAG: helix-turn-helix domain-containing protein [Candidatus Obscuribacterales bacterium]